jgi:hypothetical protein
MVYPVIQTGIKEHHMNMHSVVGASLVAGATLLLCATPAMAHGNVQWSVNVGTPQYYAPPPAVVYSSPPTVVYPPPVVVYPQSQFTYGAPPSVYAPPPGTYIQAPQVYPQTWQVEPYRAPQGYHDRSWRERDERHDRQDRRERYGSDGRRDGQPWGNREQRR